MDLEKLICDEVKKQTNSTEFKENMQAKVKEMLNDIVSNLLKWEIKNAIEKPIKDSMLEAIEGISISDYIPKIDYLLTSVIRESSVGHYRRITENFKQLLAEETPDRIKVSELFEEYKQYCARWVSTSDLDIIVDGDRAYYEDLNCELLVEKKVYDSKLILKFSCDADTELNKEILLQKDYRGEYRLPFANYDLKSLRYLSPFEILFLRLAEKQARIEVDIHDAEDCDEVAFEPEACYE